MKILTILLVLAVISLIVFIKLVLDLDKRIAKLERKINNIQYQIEEALWDINIMNDNVLGLLSQMKDENN